MLCQSQLLKDMFVEDCLENGLSLRVICLQDDVFQVVEKVRGMGVVIMLKVCTAVLSESKANPKS